MWGVKILTIKWDWVEFGDSRENPEDELKEIKHTNIIIENSKMISDTRQSQDIKEIQKVEEENTYSDELSQKKKECKNIEILKDNE